VSKLPHEACNRTIKDLRAALAAAEAHANDLRGALERVRNTAWIGGNEGMRSMCQEALAATPAASLAAHDAEVLERAIAEITNRCVRQVGESSLIPGYNRCMDDVERAIERIRALAAQEVTK